VEAQHFPLTTRSFGLYATLTRQSDQGARELAVSGADASGNSLGAVNNARDAAASREEEIAFLIVEQVLGVQVLLADAGSGDKVPDGRWEVAGRAAVIEVTSPPSRRVMRAFAEAVREGTPFNESGSSPIHLGALGEHLTELVTQILAKDVEKLVEADADERHLFLLGRTLPDQEYFARLSDQHDDGSYEPANDLKLPDGLTDVWFRGRAQRGDNRLDGFSVWVARFSRTQGWTRHRVDIEERTLPSPTNVVDPAPDGWRSPAPRK